MLAFKEEVFLRERLSGRTLFVFRASCHCNVKHFIKAQKRREKAKNSFEFLNKNPKMLAINEQVTKPGEWPAEKRMERGSGQGWLGK